MLNNPDAHEDHPSKLGKYYLRHLERVRGESYPAIVKKVTKMMHSPMLKDNASLVVDATDVGAPLIDLFEGAGLNPVAVFIHGGDRVTQDGNNLRNWRVPKRGLVGCLQVILQSERFKVTSKLALGPILQAEMLKFRVKIDPANAHDSYSAWREADHDDLVLSVALACGWGEREASKVIIGVPTKPLVRRYSTWSPIERILVIKIGYRRPERSWSIADLPPFSLLFIA